MTLMNLSTSVLPSLGVLGWKIILATGKREPASVKRRLMELPAPDVDELGRPWWSGTSADVSKAYRRLSILVHPVRHFMS